MKSAYLFALVLYGSTSYVFGLTCYYCNQYGFNGEITYDNRCFLMNNNSLPSKQSCAQDTSTTKYYCRTQISLLGGVTHSVNRGCVSSTLDEDTTSTEMPISDKCVASSATNANCYDHCRTDDCNSKSTGNFTLCDSSCSRENNRGYCDYLSGECVCVSGWTGANCSISVPVMQQQSSVRKCVQCSSIADPSCDTKNEASNCPSNEQYCLINELTTYKTFAKGSIFDRITIFKGCTSQGRAVGGCTMNNIYNDQGITGRYVERTCSWICAEDACNTDTETALSSTRNNLYCHQCQGRGYNCHTSSQICPTNSTHCKATASYVYYGNLSNQQSATQPHAIVNVVRECATSGVPTQCRTEDIGFNVTKVTCQETCLQNGCNDGWPARPKCVQCSNQHYYYYGVSHCLTSLSPAQACGYPYQNYCTVNEAWPRSNLGLYGTQSPTVVRGCSHYDVGSGCSSNATVKTCTKACTTDSCNTGLQGAGQEAGQGIVAVSYYAP